MKSIQKLPRAAFTLIELLVVISIIALLASMAVPTANIVMRKAKEAQARAAMTGLIIGIKTYQTEYNRFPDPNNAGNASENEIELTAGNTLIPVLHPDQSATPPQANPRRINFYDPPIAKNNANGLTEDGALNDPWAHPFRVLMDMDGDGSVEDPTHTSNNNKLQTPVIAYSTGSPTSPPNENTDTKKFLCSWR